MRLKPRPFSKPQLSHPLARGLGGYWLHNEGSGLITNDLSGNGQYGIITGATRDGRGLVFDGTEDFVDLGTSPLAGLFSMSIEMVFTPAVDDTIFLILNDGTSSLLASHWVAIETNVVKFLINNGIPDNANGGTTIVPGTTYHFIGTWLAGEYPEIYINGVLDTASDTGASPQTDPLQAGDTNLVFGGRPANTNDPVTNVVFDYNGSISYVKYYNRVLSATEILQLYRNPYILFDRSHLPLWQSGGVAPTTNPKGPFTHPLWGPFSGPLVA